MNKVWISAGAIAIVGLIALGFWLTAPASQPTVTNPPDTSQGTGLPVAGSVQQDVGISAQETSISFAAIGGGTIQTSNFINDPTTAKDPNNQGYYYLGYHPYEGVSDPTAIENPPYLIVYISATQYFNIALLQEPIGPVREDMQQYLMARLGVTQDQMCRLNYMVSVPDRVNSNFSGRNLGFSFCPGATTLPK